MNSINRKISQPTYKRQRFLLTFISQLNEKITMTNLQKLVFLYSMKENSNFYDFIPYKFGPYSFQLIADIETLLRDGFLTYDGANYCAKGTWKDTTISIYSIEPERGTALIRKAYRDYPYYTIKSKIVDQCFSTEVSTLERLRDERRCYIRNDQILFTIGYESLTLESFMNKLLQNDVRTLCDVRRNPFSRKFGFSKDKLQFVSSELGIRYIHWPELGIDSSKRKALKSDEDYSILFEEYKNNLPHLHYRIHDLYSCLLSDKRIALMCFEKDPKMCHRHVIRDYLCHLYAVRSVDL